MNLVRLFPLTLVILLASCVVPMHEVYLKPVSPEGTVSKIYCGGKAGPPAVLAFEVKDARMRLHTQLVQQDEELEVRILMDWPRFAVPMIFDQPQAAPASATRFTNSTLPAAL